MSVVDRIDQFMLAVDPHDMDVLDVAAGLERILLQFGMLTLSYDTIAIQKLVFAQSDRFPELALTFYAQAIDPTCAVVENFLRRRCALGQITLEVPHVAAGMLCGMMIMEPQRSAMLHRNPAPSAAEIGGRARVCTHMFLQGCLQA